MEAKFFKDLTGNAFGKVTNERIVIIRYTEQGKAIAAFPISKVEDADFFLDFFELTETSSKEDFENEWPLTD